MKASYISEPSLNEPTRFPSPVEELRAMAAAERNEWCRDLTEWEARWDAQQEALRDLIGVWRSSAESLYRNAPKSIDANTAAGWLMKCADELARLLAEPGETTCR